MKKWFIRLAPVVLAIMLCFGSCLTVFAIENDCPNGLYGGDYYVELLGPSGNVIECTSSSPFYVFVLSGKYVMTSDSGYCQYVDGVHSSDNKFGTNITVYLDGVHSDGSVIVSSNHDVLLNDGEIFFRVPPVLEPVVKESGVEKILDQILLILPIGLACLVGWIALRKALSYLRGILRQA